MRLLQTFNGLLLNFGENQYKKTSNMNQLGGIYNKISKSAMND